MNIYLMRINVNIHSLVHVGMKCIFVSLIWTSVVYLIAKVH